MTRIINAWMINRHINNALWVYGPDAGIFSPKEQAARVDRLRQDLEGAARLELITPNQYRKLKKVIHIVIHKVIHNPTTRHAEKSYPHDHNRKARPGTAAAWAAIP